MKKSILTVLLFLFLLPLFFDRAAAAVPDTCPSDSGRVKLEGNEVSTADLQNANDHHIYEIELSATSDVSISECYDNISRYQVAIYGSNGKKIEVKTVTGTNKDLHFFLQAGKYFIGLFPDGAYGTSTFQYKAAPAKDSFPEKGSSNNNTYQKADYANLNTDYYGTLCANESKVTFLGEKVVCDCYKFSIPFTNPALCFEYSSDMHSSKLIMTRVSDPNVPIFTGDQYSASGYGHIIDYSFNKPLEPGDYYLYIYSEDSTGSYYFNLEYDIKTLTDIGLIYTTVGSRSTITSLNAESTLFQLSEPSVGTVKNNQLHAQKAGYTEGTGYFRNVDSSNRNEVIKFEAFVEFNDVASKTRNQREPYYYNAVYWAARKNITAGVKDPATGLYANFNPEGECSRAQMISFLWRMAGCPESNVTMRFTDVSESAYYYKAVAWGLETGIVGGYSDNTFRPNNVCTRAQALSFLYRYAGTPDVRPDPSTNFRDMNYSNGAYYNKAVIWATQKGITGGYSDNTFRPQNTCTRAQMVSFLYRYSNGQ